MCPTGSKGDIGVFITEPDLQALEEKGWKVIAGWLLSPQSVAVMEILPRIGVQGPVGPS
jgi:hypothetical protein